MLFTKKIACQLSVIALSCTLSQTALSSDAYPGAYQSLVTLSVGPDFVHNGQAQSLTLLPPFQNHYTSTSPWTTALDGGVFVGVERAVNEQFQFQVGIAGYLDSQMTAKGDVLQGALPVFDNLTYAYNIQHVRAMLSGKLLTSLQNYPFLHPYLSGELGVASNRASHYAEVPLIPNLPPTAPFASNSLRSFTYGVGFGFDYSVTQNIRLGLGYQFADLGSVALGTTTAESTMQTFTVPHLYTNQLRLQLTAFI